jgi:hypothetical protein
MVTWLKRSALTLFLDLLIVLALALPHMVAYMRWPLLALYALLTGSLLRKASANRWIMKIVRDPATRITHGLEHATLAVLSEDGLPTVRGFTHYHDRFMVALEAGNAHQLEAVRDAASTGIRRILDGERSLAYQPGCGTSEVVSAVTLWLVYVSSALFSLVVGGQVPVFFAVSVLVFRLWLAFERPLGLLAQRFFTVSTSFSSAAVVDVSEVSKLRGHIRPPNETWFEIVIDVRVAASQGGVVSPGVLA